MFGVVERNVQNFVPSAAVTSSYTETMSAMMLRHAFLRLYKPWDKEMQGRSIADAIMTITTRKKARCPAAFSPPTCLDQSRGSFERHARRLFYLLLAALLFLFPHVDTSTSL